MSDAFDEFAKRRWLEPGLQYSAADDRIIEPPSKIDAFKRSPAGTTGRAFLRERQARPFNLQKRRRRS